MCQPFIECWKNGMSPLARDESHNCCPLVPSCFAPMVVFYVGLTCGIHGRNWDDEDLLLELLLL